MTDLQKRILRLMDEKPFLLNREVAMKLECSHVSVERAAKLGGLTGDKPIKKSVRARIVDFVNSDSFSPGMLLRDIAEAVNCSVRTVSRAIRDMPKIEGATKHHPFIKPKKPMDRRKVVPVSPAEVIDQVNLSESGKLLAQAW